MYRIKSFAKKIIKRGFHVLRKDVITKEEYTTFSRPMRHTFFGYYDVPQFNDDENKILVHSVGKKADPFRDDAELGMFDLKNKSYKKVASTSAWCWQQGSRLRWHPYEKEKVIYNDVEDGHYVTKICDVNTGTVTKTYSRAFYDIAHNLSYGLSLNFSRLQRLRPGYGYSKISDVTNGKLAPDDDGIFITELETDKTRLLISLSDLAKMLSNENVDMDSEHYINHISISPSDDRFIFFHLWTMKGGREWKNRLFCYEFGTGKINLLEDEYKVSHYCWKNDEEILITCCEGGKHFYETINLCTGRKGRICATSLQYDGHPTYFKNSLSFVTDSYPNRRSEQRLLWVKDEKKDQVPEVIATLFHNPFMDGEKRCDLHPRVSKSNKKICIDSTCSRGTRKCIIFDWDKKENI